MGNYQGGIEALRIANAQQIGEYVLREKGEEFRGGDGVADSSLKNYKSGCQT